MIINIASKEKAIYILANVWKGMQEGIHVGLTGEKELFASLKRVSRKNECVFPILSYAYHHHHYRSLKTDSPGIPSVVFINLSLPGKVIPHEIEKAKRMLPYAVFILYSDETDFPRCLDELPNDDWKKQFRHYYSLKKNAGSNEEEFDKRVREILDEAILTSIRKREEAPQYHTAFISYSHQDKKFAFWLYDNLRSHGIRCWLDHKELVAGDKIHSKVEQAIQERDKILLCASKHSLSSWWVDNEINSAIAKEQLLWKKYGAETLTLIPLNLDNFIFSNEWESSWKNQITSRISPDFTLWKERISLDNVKDVDEQISRIQEFERKGEEVIISIQMAMDSLIRALLIKPERDK